MRITRALRGAAVAALLVGALAVAGCAGNPDVSDLESQLADVEGVNDATVGVTHSNAPWETQLVVTLYLPDASDAGIVSAVRGAAPVFVADPVGSRHEVSLFFVSGALADYEDEFDAQSAELAVTPAVYEALGLDDDNPYSVTLSPKRMRELADG